MTKAWTEISISNRRPGGQAMYSRLMSMRLSKDERGRRGKRTNSPRISSPADRPLGQPRAATKHIDRAEQDL